MAFSAAVGYTLCHSGWQLSPFFTFFTGEQIILFHLYSFPSQAGDLFLLFIVNSKLRRSGGSSIYSEI